MGFLRREYFSPPFSFSLLLLLSLLLCVPVGCTVFPSNNSADLSWTHQLRFKLHTSLSRRPFNAKLAPLTEALVDIPLSQVVVSDYYFTLLHTSSLFLLMACLPDVQYHWEPCGR